ncbi:hypothetical protein BDV97DRAFT_376998 [Delphinella strobiligena]|nr:hypothetical protein BDV97DRAFT_376998 [Delphinella strobiligena]
MDEADTETPVADHASFFLRHSHHRGRAKIAIRHYTFESSTEVLGARTLDEKNVIRLSDIYQLEGCHRLEPEHSVPAIISEATLMEALNRSGVNQSELLAPGVLPPTLQLPSSYSLHVLHGQHRIEAAKRFLDPLDHWWVVDLYADSLPDALRLEVRTEYLNSRSFCDGDIYRNLRHHQRKDDSARTGRWLARLSTSKRNDVKRLTTSPKKQSLRKALDDLLPFSGLWAPVQLGTLHRILTLQTEEELVHYLERLRDVWKKILPHDHLHPLLDPNTVFMLQLLAPSASTADKESIICLMQERTLFPMIRDSAVRAETTQRILATHGRILSLFTFFEDTKYLEPCAKIMKLLLPQKQKETIRICYGRRLSRNSVSDTQVRVQVAENSMNIFSGSRSIGEHHLDIFAKGPPSK